MAEAIFLTEEDRSILQLLLEERKARRGNKERTITNPAVGYHQSTNVYIAKPQGVIPILTGTSPAVPGTGAADIYQVIDNAGSPELVAVENFDHTVHNLSTSEVITAAEYVPIVKDKISGKWLSTKSGTTSSGTGGSGTAPGGDTVDLVEVIDSDGSTFTDCDEETTRQSSDCVFRARIIQQDPDTDDLCDRADVDPGTSGGEIWLHISHTPWCNPLTDVPIGTRLLARLSTLRPTYTIGSNTFPFYEGAIEDSRIWAINPTADWGTPPYNYDVWKIDDSEATGISGQPIDDPWDLWGNVVTEAGTNPASQGYGIMMGDEMYPIAMRRLATDYVGTVNFSAAVAPGDPTITVDGITRASDSPFVEEASIFVVSNPLRLSCLDNTEVYIQRDISDANNYVAIGVARSAPIMIEIKGSPDGSGQAPQLSGSTNLAVWDARVVSQNPTSPGDMQDGGGVAINQEDIWFAHVGTGVGSSGSSDPYYITTGQRYLAYDVGKNFTPTGGSARRLYVAARDSETLYGEAYENWTDNGSSVDHVRVRPIDDLDGGNRVDTISHTVLIPKNGERDPNVVSGDRISYRLGLDGLWVIHSPDGLDDKIGTVKMWALASGGIPPGWASMDGISNAPANGGSGIEMNTGASDGGGRFVRGSATAGTQGGTDEHTHPINISVDTNVFVTAMNLALDIDDHTVADLSHQHAIEKGTPSTGWDPNQGSPDQDPPLDCTAGPVSLPFGASSFQDCATGTDWGPLTHSFSVSGGGAGAFSEAFATSSIGTAKHEPENTTLIFIERIDNSV